MGRPKKEITRERTVIIHCSCIDKEIIQAKADAAGLSTSTYGLKRLRDFPLYNRLSDEELQMFRAIAGMANNLNQMIKSWHIENNLDDFIAAREVCKKILNSYYDH